ncbi:MAG: acyltransferase [Candidatus Limiplasma sp.]|nr:acyltransferase [Candidatus Limiplasma sp.]
MNTKERLGAYRNELKGIAILWVVFFHALFSVSGVLYDIQKIGYGGVDIFFFLTGFGLYHSLGKSQELSGYWKRRMGRILPAYLPLILCYLLVMYPTYGLRATQAVRGALGNLLMVGFWFGTPRLFNWYVSALAVFMLLAPLLYALLSKSPKPGRTLAFLLAWAFFLGLCLIGDERYMGVSRLPIFLLGMAFAMDWRPALGALAKRLLLALSFFAGLAVLLLCFARYPELLNDYGMYWHPFALITPPLCLFLSFLLSKADKARRLFAPLRALGRASFEIYLLNIWLVEWGKREKLTGDLPWLLLCLGCILGGLGYHWLIHKLGEKIQRKNIQKPSVN